MPCGKCFMTRVKDVARHAKVSTATVSRVLIDTILSNQSLERKCCKPYDIALIVLVRAEPLIYQTSR